MTSFTTDIAGAVGLLLLVLAAVVFFWLWSRHNEKATVERIKKYQLPLEVDATPGPSIEAPPRVAGGEVPVTEMANDLAEQFDDKIAILSRLLQIAEEQAVRLEQAIEEAKRLGR
ncbi:MAG: hypothetical protein HY288_00820 [Planctomycetia bacterium]|nr:hypothetical protein [Planctomycetia bacterium]